MVANFGYDAGGWRVDRHPRFLADTTGDGRADIVGFGNAGVYVSRAQADGSFAAPQLVVDNFGYDAGGWRVERHPRFLADTTGDGRADIVGFGNAGVWVSRAQADGSYAAPQLVVGNFGYDAGGWRVERHPRFVADIDRRRPRRHRRLRQRRRLRVAGAGRRQLRRRQLVVANFGYDAGGWRVEQPPALPGRHHRRRPADIVGFGNAGVWVSRALADGGYEAPGLVITNFGYDAGGWRVDQAPAVRRRHHRRRPRRHRRLRQRRRLAAPLVSVRPQPKATPKP